MRLSLECDGYRYVEANGEIRPEKATVACLFSTLLFFVVSGVRVYVGVHFDI